MAELQLRRVRVERQRFAPGTLWTTELGAAGSGKASMERKTAQVGLVWTKIHYMVNIWLLYGYYMGIIWIIMVNNNLVDG
jgi:hypothetical protein